MSNPSIEVQPTNITVTIGKDIVTYELWTTRAPRGADYNYVMELYEGDGLRYVLIPIQHVPYQTTRYGSFLGADTRPSNDMDQTHIAEKLWFAMTKALRHE